MGGRDALVAAAVGEIGYSEDPPGSNRTKFGAWYGIQDEWCAIFVSWCAYRSGNVAAVPRFAWTPAGADWFRGRGAFDRSPTVGAIAFYDVSGLGRISHTGIVDRVLGDGSWTAIEGNSSAGGSRTGGSVIRNLRNQVGRLGGFGHPAFALDEPVPGQTWHGRGFTVGSTGDRVLAIQGALSRALTASRQRPIGQDGIFGPQTVAAVRWFQLSRGLGVDGIVGPITWNALAP
jgi:Putative peptidoglycan binding domain/CHAP domain